MARRLLALSLALLSFLALPRQSAAATARPERDSLAVAWLADCARFVGERRYAEMDSVAALALARLSAAERPDSNALASAHFYRGYSRVQRAMVSGPEASGHFADAARVFAGMARPDTLSWASTLDAHTWLLINLARGDSAVRQVERARALCRPSVRGADSLLAEIWYTSGRAYRAAGRTELAIAALDSCRQIRVRRLGADHPRVAEPIAELGAILMRAGRLEEAVQLLDGAIRQLERGGAETINRLPGALGDLATALFRLGDVARSVETIEKQLAVYVTRDGAESRYLIPPLYSIGLRLYEFGDHAGARTVFEDALRRAEAGLGAGNDRTEIGGAVNYFFHRHTLKLQSDFRQLEDKGRGVKAHELRVQTYVAF